jgi:uncharacterized OsmC-like protein/fermentation-respiration switch protein FrsA (DUF1100 family)
MSVQKLEFEGGNGAQLAARLELPAGEPIAYAIFAHCFTCSKDLNATRRISSALSVKGIAVLSFDFTGLGHSQGEFASTNFSSNIADLVRAADFLKEKFQSPSLLIGHSLGGAAVLVAASSIPSVKAVVTIGAPADANHVTHNFGAKISEIDKTGKAEVSLGGRNFTIQKQFLKDLAGSSVTDHVRKLKKPLLILHAPLDQTVGVENAGELFSAAKHPKSFISLDQADHLLSNAKDAEYVAASIASWSLRYLPKAEMPDSTQSAEGVLVRETRSGKFQNEIFAGKHHLLADEPASYGGDDTGPSPYEYMSAALGACTNMTLRMYSDRKSLGLGEIKVEVIHDKIHGKDCEECAESVKEAGGKIDQFHRIITVDAALNETTRDKILEIADQCPVHKTLHATSHIKTSIA